jgi:sugar lactone lactonase YvrE
LKKGPSSLVTIDTGVPVGITADIEGEEDIILVGAKNGVSKFNMSTSKHEYIAKFFPGKEDSVEAKSMRANDGAVDSSGRFWVEIFTDPTVKEPGEEGKLFRLDLDGKLHTMYENVTIPNGISWNAEDNTMFFTDSPAQNVYAFDYDSQTGDISNKRTFFHLDEEGVHPDGHIMDVEGHIWHACFSGSKVIRISPEGEVVGEVKLPTRCITCVAFVGTEIYITSAEEPEPEKYPESAKFGGNVFRVDVGVEGMHKHKARFP